MAILRCRLIVAGKFAILSGEPTVGKTALIKHLEGEVFSKNYIMTQGLDYKIKEFKMDAGDVVELHILDMSGRDIYREIVVELLKNANRVAYVYDITNPETFGQVREWAQMVCEQNGKDVQGVLIANKSDLEDRRKVSGQQGVELAQDLGVEFFEMSSAYTMHQDQAPCAFEYIAKSFYEAYKERKAQIYEMQE